MSLTSDEGRFAEFNRNAMAYFQRQANEQATPAVFKRNPVMIPMSREMARDYGLLPAWEFPERNPMPVFAPLRSVVRAQKALADLRAFRQRARDAWAVLQGQETIYDPEDDW